MKAAVLSLFFVLGLGGVAFADDDGDGSDSSSAAKEQAAPVEETCDGGEPCKKKPVDLFKGVGSMDSNAATRVTQHSAIY